MFLVLTFCLSGIALPLLGWLLSDSVEDIEQILIWVQFDVITSGIVANWFGRSGFWIAVLGACLYIAAFIQLGFVDWERLMTLITHWDSVLLFVFFFVCIIGCCFYVRKQVA